MKKKEKISKEGVRSFNQLVQRKISLHRFRVWLSTCSETADSGEASAVPGELCSVSGDEIRFSSPGLLADSTRREHRTLSWTGTEKPEELLWQLLMACLDEGTGLVSETLQVPDLSLSLSL